MEYTLRTEMKKKYTQECNKILAQVYQTKNVIKNANMIENIEEREKIVSEAKQHLEELKKFYEKFKKIYSPLINE